MILEFNRELLLDTLKKAIMFVPKKATITACENFLFMIVGNICRMTATDMEKQITVSCVVKKSSNDGMFTIPATLLVKSLSLMIDEDVRITFKEDIVEVKCGKSKYKMSGEDGQTYPIMANVESKFEASFPGSVFNAAIDIAKKYTDCKNDILQFKQGVCLRLDTDTNKINFYATTGFQICRITVTPRSINSWDDAVIPVDTVVAINKCISSSDIVEIAHNKTKIEVRTEHVVIVSRLFDIVFPNMDKFYAHKHEAKIKLNTSQTTLALQRLALVASPEFSQVNFYIKGNELSMVSDDPMCNREGVETIEVNSTLDAAIGFNIHFILSSLSSFDNDEFEFSYTDTRLPILIEPISALNENFLSLLIAPIKIN